MAECTADNNNWVYVAGKVDSAIEFNHEMYGEGFYSFFLAVPRLSSYVDRLPVTVSERLIDEIDLNTGSDVVISGQFRSYNKLIDGSNKLVLTVFVREIGAKTEEIKNPNQIYLNGYVCKPPVYRMTPFKREIADLLIAVNRAYNKSDYIPTIAWGRNARFCRNIEVGNNLKIWGRIQSREYQKRYPDGEVIEKTAYEVSVSKMELVREEANE
ncbi:MAG: single-stranded DNA-binding protein [Caldicoprobacterales bacterium]|jgi:primosomal replication protein N|nr:single-stranded DNA-binding protein [Clostridiales bacterium]